MTELDEIKDALVRFADELKKINDRGEKILVDFDKPIVRWCEWCHYPFAASSPGHIKPIYCPKHRPAHWPKEYIPDPFREEESHATTAR